ncbi:unnamed protein product [Acanthoscelides obtectus]|uniref:DDE Tnp4 domain-containing protein n=2 Tax=Acanthoscelides obtectus TaxID=200917 RepID=A0A9P0MF07_ACAOB|nr:unnamed protein product [Acanthoscelides obtectus]CAK1680400.1 Protein ALP1-like [Acanthoscelides obtectus]
MDSRVVASAAFVVLSGCMRRIKAHQVQKAKGKRRWWMTSLSRSRERYNVSIMIEDLIREPSGRLENFLRMSYTDFEFLLNEVGHMIGKKDTQLRKAISVKERFCVALRFFASGDSFVSLSYLFKFLPQTVSRCVFDVCDALISVLNHQIKMPRSSNEWKKIAIEFENRWNFPHCLGAIDGKHILIQSPMNSGSDFFNYKHTFSVVMMALVDANYMFTYVDVGCQGRISDGGVFRNTVLGRKLEENRLMLPNDETLPNHTQTTFPYVFVADDAFALGPHLLKPFQGVYEAGSDERVFNYRLSRARRIVENAFGILASVFRVFRAPMLLQPDKVSKVAMTCALLHNFLRSSKDSSATYAPPGAIDTEQDGTIIPGTWRSDVQNMTSFLPLKKIPRKAGREAQEIRKLFCGYFKTTGKVHWQDRYC